MLSGEVQVSVLSSPLPPDEVDNPTQTEEVEIDEKSELTFNVACVYNPFKYSLKLSANPPSAVSSMFESDELKCLCVLASLRRSSSDTNSPV